LQKKLSALSEVFLGLGKVFLQIAISPILMHCFPSLHHPRLMKKRSATT